MENINKNLPRDVFLYLLSVVTMAISAIAFGTIIFQIINVYLPDVLSYESTSSAYDSMRYAMAGLIVVFPVYVWLMKFLGKDIEINPEKKELRIRKWLLYFTLFVSAVVIIVDLITLIYNFLQGELSVRFVLKFLTILLISGVIFIYYKKILKSEEIIGKSFITSILPKIIIVIVGVSIISGFFITGLPKNQRLVRLDERRISDLLSIDNKIDNYWINNRKLPDNLSQLETALNVSLPVDPVSDASYEYIKQSDLKFELCAVFQTSAKDNVNYDITISKPINQFYAQLQNHTQGRNCFEKTINPFNYPIKEFAPTKRPVPIAPI